MVLIAKLFSVLALATAPVAANRRHECLDSDTAWDLVETFQYFYVKADLEVAKNYLHKDFVLYSDSQVFVTPGTPPVRSHTTFATVASTS